ncbi:MAG: DUF21 domain-containing protein [Proteobacteria bacterium]|nr:DUF21 domain-containing protein [Pseudomonadota bacterium]MBU1687725.1 DUF21 domain-containing protein [Pseudomonadota bacterium]
MYIWLGIIFCISQSALFSGLNLAVFSVSRLRLEVEVSSGNIDAEKVIKLRDDANFLLTTILWGNVGINVLLTLLSNSVLTGVSAFFFSTLVITFAGEILPQAYFSRNALKMAAILYPAIRFYQYLLYPIAKPSALMLDALLGKETIWYMQEKDIRNLLKKHIASDEVDIDMLEGIGALNFLDIDDMVVSREGEVINPDSVIQLPVLAGKPQFPKVAHEPTDPFLLQVHSSGKKWAIITDPIGTPIYVMDIDKLIRDVFFGRKPIVPITYCHRPIMVTDPHTPLGKVISRLKVFAEHPGDDVIDQDIILVWAEEKRVITGADILGRLMRGISNRQSVKDA